MCGIVGIVAKDKDKNVIPMVYECLRRLEYRGYDSFGIGTISPRLKIFKQVGAIGKATDLMTEELSGSIGLAHTRWATHGGVSVKNAHPQTDCNNKISVVHNGIISNHRALRDDLERKGHIFVSDTDTEVIAHLVEEELKTTNDFEKAAVNAIRKLKGSFAIVIGSDMFPDMLLAFRKESPLVLGLGDEATFAASDIVAFLGFANKIIPLDDFQYAVITRNGCEIKNWETMETLELKTQIVTWSYDAALKGDFDSYMEKEIFEQPRAFRESLYVDNEIIKNIAEKLLNAKRIYITASGTSYHAGLVMQYLLKKLVNIPSITVISSEFENYAIVDKDTAVVFISQSGETADTLHALRYTKKHGGFSIGIVNVVGSSIARECDATIYIHAGPEIAVCATKTFLNQLSIIYQIVFEIARIKKSLPADELNALIREFRNLPDVIEETLQRTNDYVKQIAEEIYDYDKSFYIGRGIGVPVAKEGSLKLREITYSFSMSFDGAGELKHGSISLIDSDMFVVAIVQNDETRDDMLGNIQECKSRGGKIITVTSFVTKEIIEKSDYIIKTPEVNPLFTPIIYTVPLQLLAVYTTKIRGYDPDRPRALAKSVTVK